MRPAPAAEKKSEKPYALIFGTVWSPDNHPLYGVRVRIRRADDKKPRWELYSDHNGEFAQRVPAARLITGYGLISKGISLAITMSYGWVPRSQYTSNMTREPTLVCI